MIIEEYVSKPRTVQAVQVTVDNMAEVAEWCGGMIKENGDPSGAGSYIYLEKAHRPQNARQKEGHVDDWIVRQGDGFKVFLAKAFKFNFDKVPVVTSTNQVAFPFPGYSLVKGNTPIHDALVQELHQARVTQMTPEDTATRIEQYIPQMTDEERAEFEAGLEKQRERLAALMPPKQAGRPTPAPFTGGLPHRERYEEVLNKSAFFAEAPLDELPKMQPRLTTEETAAIVDAGQGGLLDEEPEA